MKYRLRVFFLGFLLSGHLWAWDWPLANIAVIKDFAGDSGEDFFPGIALKAATENETVHAMNDGEIVFLRQPGRRKPPVPWISAHTVLIDHTDGIRGMYSGLIVAKELKEPKDLKVQKGQSLGTVGTTSYFSGQHLVVTMYDLIRNGIVNPAVVCQILTDNRRPSIQAVSVQWTGDQSPVSLSTRAETLVSSFRLFAQLRDQMPVHEPTQNSEGLPLRIRILLNGKVVFKLDKLALRYQNSANVLFHTTLGQGMHSLFYGNGGPIDCGTITLDPGINRLEIVIADYAGNRSGAQYRIHYRAPSADTSTINQANRPL